MTDFTLCDKINITEEEQKLFDFLLSVVEKNQSETVLRIAGGWVRDKLMGLDADDIDISLDNMTGAEFGILVKEQISNDGNLKQKVKKQKTTPKVAVIGIRPELGKFVETATVHCHNFSLDLLSLRSQVQVGDILRKSDHLNEDLVSQAAEDAHLRDFTINALFYNINTGCVEDFVGGKNDIVKKIIRCPNGFDRAYFLENQKSDPEKEKQGTELRLREDPLRSLRAIRFACKHDFELSQCIKESIFSSQVQNFLLMKTTNERILTETQKIFSLDVEKALRGLSMIAELKLLRCVFPMACELPNDFWSQHIDLCLKCCSEILRTSKELLMPQSLLILSSFFTPLSGKFVFSNSAEHEFPLTREHMKETWKYPTKHSSDVLDVMTAAVQLKQLKDEEWTNDHQVVVGRLLRRTKEKWIHACDIAKVWEILEAPMREESIKQKYSSFISTIEQKGLTGKYGITPWEMKPIFTGKDLATKFNVKPGKQMGVLIEILIDWRLVNMNGTEEQAKLFLQNYIDTQ